MKQPIRVEQDIFSELAALCVRPGYLHAIAYLCFRDNVILYRGKMREADMRQMFSPSRLIRSEINTLLGLTVKADVEWTLPSPATLQQYIDDTERLLGELHQALSGKFLVGMTKESVESGTFDPFSRAEVLREPIFYSGESAYSFQYLNLAAQKYGADAEWLRLNKGFTIEQASRVARAIEQLHASQLDVERERMRRLPVAELTMIPLFAVSTAAVADATNLDIDVVERILVAYQFPVTERNAGFSALSDFNAITATPLLRLPTGEFLSLQAYALAEAIYDTPFYWMAKDRKYLPTLTKNRGDFTENLVAERFRKVFGNENVHLNVDIFENKATRISDVDVLVVWGDRVVITQAKSKRLTLEARRGNDQVIRDDFAKAVQAAYDQGNACAKCILEGKFKLQGSGGVEVALPRVIKEVYILCVVSDHYPALSFQTREFLKTAKIDRVLPPLVMDVFAIDTMTEMLQSPLQLLSYINRRTNYADRIMASNELTILGYHLTKNLWLQSDVSLAQIHDDFSAGLDIAMAARRTGLHGASTPDGLLTRFVDTTFGHIVKAIESRPDPETVDLGFLLLALNEEAITQMTNTIDALASRTKKDGQVHDATFAGIDDCGITFHCTDEPSFIARKRLMSHCNRRKYKERATAWFGLCVDSKGPNLRFAVSLDYPWAFDLRMENETKGMATPIPAEQAYSAIMKSHAVKAKIRRNDPCPCASGKKYKKCCGN